jgi:hypothetical protein
VLLDALDQCRHVQVELQQLRLLGPVVGDRVYASYCDVAVEPDVVPDYAALLIGACGMKLEWTVRGFPILKGPDTHQVFGAWPISCLGFSNPSLVLSAL